MGSSVRESRRKVQRGDEVLWLGGNWGGGWIQQDLQGLHRKSTLSFRSARLLRETADVNAQENLGRGRQTVLQDRKGKENTV